MNREIHDQFAKDYLSELLSHLGEVETSREVTSEVRQVDVYFIPATTPKDIDPKLLGLLAPMAKTAGLFEPFRNPPTPVEISNCLVKLFGIQGEQRRQARQENVSQTQLDSPRLWILSPSISTRILRGFRAKPDESEEWPPGIYFLPKFFYTGLVAIHQLPVTPETLWLRVLGRGEVQKAAIDELVALPEANPLRRYLLEILASWRINVELSQNLDEQEKQELTMNLSPAYLRWREETFLEGRQEGLQEGLQEERRSMIENFLRVRFGEVDEQLSQIIESMLGLPTAELTVMLLNFSRSELLERFGQNP
jgi:hypothetical protein